MGAALEVVSGRAVNPSGTFTALTPNTNDSFSVRNFADGSPAFLVTGWALGATAGITRLRSPRLHDNVQGIRTKYTAAQSGPTIPRPFLQKLYAQDLLVAEMTGGAAETDLASFLIYYTDLPGSAGRFMTADQVDARGVNILSNEVSLVSGATLGDYSGAVALNSSFDLLKANTDYAVIGYLTDTMVGTVGLRGPDVGGVRVGMPGTTDRNVTREWFTELSRFTGLPTIPVINSANKAGTIIDVAHTANAVTTIVDFILVELAR